MRITWTTKKRDEELSTKREIMGKIQNKTIQICGTCFKKWQTETPIDVGEQLRDKRIEEDMKQDT